MLCLVDNMSDHAAAQSTREMASTVLLGGSRRLNGSSAAKKPLKRIIARTRSVPHTTCNAQPRPQNILAERGSPSNTL
jgi:hypothetical protein